MKEIFTVEEINLLCIYDTSDRAALIEDLKISLADVYEPEMREIIHNTIAKLETLTDAELSEMGFYIADEYTDEEDFAIAE